MAELLNDEPQPVAVPHHLAIIMDGNGRWATRHGYSIARGHRQGAKTARTLMRGCADRGIKILTLFAFSSENWQRPRAEVNALLSLFTTYLRGEVNELHREQVRLQFIGDRTRLRSGQSRMMREAEELTADNSRCTLVVAIDYGGRWDLVNAARQVARAAVEQRVDIDQIDATMLQSQLSTSALPHPDMLIRTGGEQRISNFLLWQCAYSELYFTPLLWPDFDAGQLDLAIAEFGQRQRRFGTRNSL